jgi:hypothetical protein
MWSDSAAATHAERDTLQRRFPRQILRTMTYVTLDDAGAATLHDLSLGGCALQSASPVPEDGPVRLRFELGTPRVRIDAVGKVVWTHASGIAGVQFVELPVKAEKQLKEWMLSSVLAGAARVMGESSHAAAVTLDGQLTLSGIARPVIPLGNSYGVGSLAVPSKDGMLRLPWWPRPILAQKLSWWMDGLVIAAAVLLFGLVFLPIAEEQMDWISMSGVMLAAVGVFTGVYWLLFTVLGAPSIGEQVVGLATRTERELLREREINRFR